MQNKRPKVDQAIRQAIMQTFDKITVWGEIPGAGNLLSVDLANFSIASDPLIISAIVTIGDDVLRIHGEAVALKRHNPSLGDHTKIYILTPEINLQSSGIRDAKLSITEVTSPTKPLVTEKMKFN